LDDAQESVISELVYSDIFIFTFVSYGFFVRESIRFGEDYVGRKRVNAWEYIAYTIIYSIVGSFPFFMESLMGNENLRKKLMSDAERKRLEQLRQSQRRFFNAKKPDSIFAKLLRYITTDEAKNFGVKKNVFFLIFYTTFLIISVLVWWPERNLIIKNIISGDFSHHYGNMTTQALTRGIVFLWIEVVLFGFNSTLNGTEVEMNFLVGLGYLIIASLSVSTALCIILLMREFTHDGVDSIPESFLKVKQTPLFLEKPNTGLSQ